MKGKKSGAWLSSVFKIHNLYRSAVSKPSAAAERHLPKGAKPGDWKRYMQSNAHDALAKALATAPFINAPANSWVQATVPTLEDILKVFTFADENGSAHSGYNQSLIDDVDGDAWSAASSSDSVSTFLHDELASDNDEFTYHQLERPQNRWVIDFESESCPDKVWDNIGLYYNFPAGMFNPDGETPLREKYFNPPPFPASPPRHASGSLGRTMPFPSTYVPDPVFPAPIRCRIITPYRVFSFLLYLSTLLSIFRCAIVLPLGKATSSSHSLNVGSTGVNPRSYWCSDEYWYCWTHSCHCTCCTRGPWSSSSK